MNENAIPTSVAFVYLLWIFTGGALLASWIVMATDHPHTAIMLGFTTIILAALASVGTVRSYVMRVCSLIRATYGAQGGTTSPAGDLHPIR